MTLNINAKLEGKSDLCFQNLANFHQSTFESLKIGTLMVFFHPKWKTYELKIYWGVMCHDNEE